VDRILTRLEVQSLDRTAQGKGELASSRGNFRDVRNALLVQLLLRTGMIRMEARRLKVRDLYLEGEEAWIRIRGKSNRSRTVRIGLSLHKKLAWFIDYLGLDKGDHLFFASESNPARPLTNASINVIWSKMCKAAGVRDLGVSSARQTFAAHLLARTKDPRLVARQLGYSNVKRATEFMGKVDPELEGLEVDANEI